ncbi:putative major facilitator superfamily transporter [Colletotrichum sublineola]|uniref:Putative major facilitator superfamily transporter n=1 Tax=Colletotrichum sublineola TaxID=1173701 RepID=A0A066XHU4_COLSU|nr:putative major facilitator superfamily transporter [Colletotrichum sublineola]
MARAPGEKQVEKKIEDTGESSVPTRIPFWRKVIDQPGITPEVENHRYAGSGTEADPFLVHWIPNDPRDPMNLGKTVRWSLAVMVAWTTFAVSFLSSGYTAGIPEITKQFRVSEEIATLGVSFYVLGFAIGPLVWAPLSELYGRQLMFFISYGLLTAFTAGGAGANSIATVLVLRFFAGSFGSSPLSNSGGVITDIFPDSERGLAVCFFSAAPFLGPTLGPILGGFFVTANGWRWLMGLLTIISGVFWILGTAVVPETYAPYLLRRRAAELSKRTGKCYVSKSEHGKPKVTVGQNLMTALSRPRKEDALLRHLIQLK